MPSLTPTQAAELAGVSADTVRRWADGGRLATTRDARGHRTIDGADLAAFLVDLAGEQRGTPGLSARNRFRGIVTRVVRDEVAATVEIQAGPHRIVSLMSREACDELGLKAGVAAIAAIKSTNVVVEVAE